MSPQEETDAINHAAHEDRMRESESRSESRFPFPNNAEDHQPDCMIRTSRDGWDADCTCVASDSQPDERRQASQKDVPLPDCQCGAPDMCIEAMPGYRCRAESASKDAPLSEPSMPIELLIGLCRAHGPASPQLLEAVADRLTALQSTVHRLEAELLEWIKASRPGGWIDELREQLTALSSATAEQRMFPIQDGPAIPWVVIAQFDKQCQKNHGGQTLERIAKRGGLSVLEAIAVLTCQEWYPDFERSSLVVESQTPAGKVHAINTLTAIVQKQSAATAEQRRITPDMELEGDDGAVAALVADIRGGGYSITRGDKPKFEHLIDVESVVRFVVLRDRARRHAEQRHFEAGWNAKAVAGEFGHASSCDWARLAYLASEGEK